MYIPLRLTNTLHPNAGNGPDDTLAAKRVLSQLGYYEVPDYDLTPYPDKHQFISSRFVKEIGRLGGDIGHFVPGAVKEKMDRRFKELGQAAQ